MKTILLLAASLSVPTAMARSILNKKTPILIYQSTAKKNGSKVLELQPIRKSSRRKYCTT